MWSRLTKWLFDAPLRDRLRIAEAEAAHWKAEWRAEATARKIDGESLRADAAKLDKELAGLRASMTNDNDALATANARAEGAEHARLDAIDEIVKLKGHILRIRDVVDECVPKR